MERRMSIIRREEGQDGARSRVGHVVREAFVDPEALRTEMIEAERPGDQDDRQHHREWRDLTVGSMQEDSSAGFPSFAGTIVADQANRGDLRDVL